MQFFSKVRESESLTWNTHSQTQHSISIIAYLGQVKSGWSIFQLKPRFNDKTMTGAVNSVCINMRNPDEEGDIQPKYSRLIEVDNNGSNIVEVEDHAVFLNHLRYCKCITKEDATLISDTINRL